MDEPAIQLEQVSYTYEDDRTPTIQGLSLTIKPGEWVAITGRNGSGKSTLSGLLSGDLPRAGGGVREGRLQVLGIDPSASEVADIASRIGLIFQDTDAQLVVGQVEGEVAFGPENLRVDPLVIEQRVTAALEEVQLARHRTRAVRSLSGGQRQRTVIAAVLSMKTPIVVFDEAAASLDQASRQRLVALLGRLHREGRTILTLSARLDDIAESASRLVVLHQGTVVLDGALATLVQTEGKRLTELGVLPAREPASAALQKLEAKPGPSEASDGAAPCLQLRELSFAYPGTEAGQPRALEKVSLSLEPGEWALLCGENGSGKTTLSRLLLGLLPLPKGAVYWQGTDAAQLRLGQLAEGIGYVFQEPDDQFVSGRVLDEMLYGPLSQLSKRYRKQRAVPQELMQRAERLLKAAGLSGKEESSPYLLSGGEKRLLGVAAQFMVSKQLYVLDEPTSGMDYAGVELLKGLCREVKEAGAALLIITHEPEQFAEVADLSIYMDQGSISRICRRGV